ncbi:MAG TPA: hypothetical protein DCW97_02600 [Acidobacteria bacterium]|nr:hypothetical protein [Acidobacteriota bacterium]
MNPLFYRIRKYTSDGQPVKSFVNPNFKQPELKHGQQVILNGPYYLEKGLLLVQLQEHLDQPEYPRLIRWAPKVGTK